MKIKPFNWLIYLVILVFTMDYFRYVFISVAGGSSYYVLMVVAFAACLMKSRSVLINITFKRYAVYFYVWCCAFIIVYGFVATSQYYQDLFGISMDLFAYQMIIMLVVFTIVTTVIHLQDDDLSRTIIKLVIISMIINAILTLRALVTNPNIARLIATGQSVNDADSFYGISGFAIIYGLLTIVPMFFPFFHGQNKRYSIFSAVFLILMGIFIFSAGFTTAIMILASTLIIYPMMRLSKIKIFILAPIYGAILYFWGNIQTLYNILNYLAEIIPIQEVSKRFYQLALYLAFNDASGDALMARSVAYQRSLSAFIEYPLTGKIIFSPDYPLSGHSTILDTMGGLGIGGLLLFILFLVYNYKFSTRTIVDTKWKSAVFTSHIAFAGVCVLNPIVSSPVIVMMFMIFTHIFPAYMISNKWDQTQKMQQSKPIKNDQAVI